jgi:hypothetical protein
VALRESKGTVSAAQAEFLTGIGYITILRDLKRGILLHEGDHEIGEKYQINVDDLESYAFQKWDHGKCFMYRPERVTKNILHFVYNVWD